MPTILVTINRIIEVPKEKEIKPDGYNIGMNCGVTSGFKGDVDNPIGGLRHCVMNKGYYQ